MEKVTKVYFDPLATTKDEIRALLKDAPLGTAHPFGPEGLLLVHSAPGTITETDISMHSEDYFSSAVNLGDLGEGILERMRIFEGPLKKFNEEYIVQQAPSSTFTVPLVHGEITIFAVSKRAPTYYDLCIADSEYNTSCYSAKTTFPGLIHSGDINTGSILLQHVKIDAAQLKETPYAVFVSGYSYTLLTKYREENPVVLVANHEDKALYIVPVPLDSASIGKAMLCVPMVVKASLAENSLTCTILPTPTTDDHLMCSSKVLQSDCFKKAIDRADFTLDLSIDRIVSSEPNMILSDDDSSKVDGPISLDPKHSTYRKHLMLATQKVVLPKIRDRNTTQVIRFGNGIDWIADDISALLEGKSSSVLPCALGGVLEGPLLLATGDAPTSLPFHKVTELHRFYCNAESVVVVVDQNMTDNARNIATKWRINALFIIQDTSTLSTSDRDILPWLENLNINAVTALAGPQSLVLAQIGERYFYYRGIAGPILNTTEWKFGHEVTEHLRELKISTLMSKRWPRLVDLSKANKVFFPKSEREVLPGELSGLFERFSLVDVEASKSDILGAIPQLQALLDQKDLEKLCATLLAVMQAKIDKTIAGQKKFYIEFLRKEYKVSNAELQKKKSSLLAALRRATKDAQTSIGWLTDGLGNVLSSQTTSTHKHDLKRLLRKGAIQNNVEAVKGMTFEKLAALLEEYAEEMGVLLVNINTPMYRQLLADPNSKVITASHCCELDSRVLHLEGFDAGIILEQSQNEHSGPLVSQTGPAQPILALPYLNEGSGTGSMLAWVCWDEFVNLEDPYSVRWMEKCNDAHIAALRIIMRSTLSNAISSRDLKMTASSVETGQLIGSLLMATMIKLAAMRTSSPVVVTKATDTSMKLMRGLFGHLLTLAGSGMNPLSKVWQLFSLYPQLDAPTTSTAWSWYENTSQLFPYTGWAAAQFNENLEKLLNKVFFRLITKNKLSDTGSVAKWRRENMLSACVTRNVQLLHSRTIVIGLTKILENEGHAQEMAESISSVVPKHVQNQTESYTRLYSYMLYLANGGEPRSSGNLTAANVFTKRSAIFSRLKTELAIAVDDADGAQAKTLCRKIIEKRDEISLRFSVDSEKMHVQGIDQIQKILEASDDEYAKDKKFCMRIKGDAEIKRQPWQIGNGECGIVEPFDEDWLESVLRGTSAPKVKEKFNTLSKPAAKIETEADPWVKFAKLMRPDFLKDVQVVDSCDQVCKMLEMPQSMMRAFIEALSPNFPWERLPTAFKGVVYSLLENQNQEMSRPAKQLFGVLMIEEPGL